MTEPLPSPVGDITAPYAGESMLRNLLANLDGLVYRGRIDGNWTMEFLSHGCLTLTGYDVEELLNNRDITYNTVTHPLDRDRVTVAIREQVSRGLPFSLEYRIVRKDGLIRWVWERGIGAKDDNGSYVAIEGLIQDVTPRMESELALQEAERRFRSIFENAVEGIFQATIDAGYIAVNPSLASMYGYACPSAMLAELKDASFPRYVDSARKSAFLTAIKDAGRVTGFESQVRRRDGKIIWVSENVRMVAIPDKNECIFEGSVIDITERKSYERKIRFQATHDALTGLPNRYLLYDRMQQAIAAAHRNGTKVALMFIDLDRFKLINDSLGHQIGDELLRVVATRLSLCVRAGDTVARQGGDEFVVLLCDLLAPNSVDEIVSRVLSEVAAPALLNGREVEVTCSVGISVYPDDGADVKELLQHSDAAMYAAKGRGRNSSAYFAAAMNAHSDDRLDLLYRLRSAVLNEDFILHYQPKIRLMDGVIIGVEALIRWEDTVRGTVSPAEFIPFSEENGLINAIGIWVLKTACQQSVAWQQAGLAPLVMSVNLSPHQLSREDFIDVVREIIASTGIDPTYLEFEITETAVMEDVERSLAVLQCLKALGVRIAIDDFGTGYSSLYYLKRFPVDTLKIDRFFINEITSSPKDAAIVAAIVSLAHLLKLSVVAEGIETDEQCRFLTESGCEEAQGHLFYKPMPGLEATTLLVKNQNLLSLERARST